MRNQDVRSVNTKRKDLVIFGYSENSGTGVDKVFQGRVREAAQREQI